MQPGMPNIDASRPHIPFVAQQLGSMNAPMTVIVGQRASPMEGVAHAPPCIAVPQVLVVSSAQQAVMKPPGNAGGMHIVEPHLTGAL
jgi:hypothetical protein